MDSIWKDAVLTDDDYKVLRGAVVETPVWGLASRDVLPTRKIDAGLQIYGYQTLDSSGSADTIKPAGDFPALQLDGTLSSVNIPKIGVAFNVTREDVLSARRSGMSLDAKNAEYASRQVQAKENAVIWNGDTKFKIDGVVADATGAYTSEGWGGASDNPFEDVRKAWNQVADEYSDRRMSLVCNRDNYSQLLRKNDYTDMAYKNMIEEDLNIYPVMDTNYTSGSALLIPEGSDVCEVVIAEDLDMEMEYQSVQNQVYKGLVYLRSAPVVYVPSAIVAITSIDAD